MLGILPALRPKSSRSIHQAPARLPAAVPGAPLLAGVGLLGLAGAYVGTWLLAPFFFTNAVCPGWPGPGYFCLKELVERFLA